MHTCHSSIWPHRIWFTFVYNIRVSRKRKRNYLRYFRAIQMAPDDHCVLLAFAHLRRTFWESWRARARERAPIKRELPIWSARARTRRLEATLSGVVHQCLNTCVRVFVALNRMWHIITSQNHTNRTTNWGTMLLIAHWCSASALMLCVC